MANFVWRPAKAARNLKEHKVSFEAAKRVFDDPFAIDEIDDREDYGRSGQTSSAWSSIDFSSSRTQ